MAFCIHFHQVGRGDLSWDDVLDEVNEENLEDSVRRNRALMSRDIGFTGDNPFQPMYGYVMAGIRAVGNWWRYDDESNRLVHPRDR